MAVGRGLIYPSIKRSLNWWATGKRVTPLIWWISNADGEQVEWGTGRVVNTSNQCKHSENHCYTRGQIYETNNMDLGRPFVNACSNLQRKSFEISSEALLIVFFSKSYWKVSCIWHSRRGWAFSALSSKYLFKNIHQRVQRVNFHFEISCWRFLCALLTVHYSHRNANLLVQLRSVLPSAQLMTQQLARQRCDRQQCLAGSEYLWFHPVALWSLHLERASEKWKIMACSVRAWYFRMSAEPFHMNIPISLLILACKI